MKDLNVMYDFGTVSEIFILDFMKNYGLTLPKKGFVAQRFEMQSAPN